VRIPFLALGSIVTVATVLCGCGGGGGGAGDDTPPPPPPASLFPAGVRAQDLVAATYADEATGEEYLVLGDVLGRGQAVVEGLDVSDGTFVHLAWSPDHTLLGVLAAPDFVTGTMLYAVEPLSGEVRQVSGVQPLGDPLGEVFAWSPDGRHLAFQRPLRPHRPVFTVDADGSNLVEASGAVVAGGGVFAFAWAPDSSRLAISMNAETLGEVELFVVPRDGSSRVKVSGTPAANASVHGFLWSPDSTRLAFSGAFDEPGVVDLFVTSSSGGPRVRPYPADVPGRDALGFEWAPDGSRLGYVGELVTDGVSEVFTCLPDGSGHVGVGGPVTKAGFVWAPDSSRLAYVADQATDGVFELFTAPADGSAPSVAVSGAMVDEGDVEALAPLAWSPDSTRLAFVADADVDRKVAVYVTSSLGASRERVSAFLEPSDELRSALVWSADSSRLAFEVGLSLFSLETKVALLDLGFAADLVADGELRWASARDAVSFAHERLVVELRPFGATADDQVHAFDLATLAEVPVILPPTPSDLLQVFVR
jgi:Tol biopolymer transport system component